MVNGNNSTIASHSNVTNGGNLNAANATNLSGTSAAVHTNTINTNFGDNLNSTSEFFLHFFFVSFSVVFSCFFLN